MKMCAALLVAAVSAPVGAIAQVAPTGTSVCVECAGSTGPARYECVVANGDRLVGVRSGERALQYTCITEIARQRGHDSCRVRRDTVGPCLGERYELLTASGQIATMPAPAEAARTGEPPDQAAGPPRTLAELAERTAASSKEGLDKAGDAISDTASAAKKGVETAGSAIGDAAGKAWRCVASLFQRCN